MENGTFLDSVNASIAVTQTIDSSTDAQISTISDSQFHFTTTTNPASERNAVSFYHRVIVASTILLFALLGLFGNALVIISVIVSKKLQTITNVLVVNLAFADFLACSFLPFQSVGLLSQTGRYPLNEVVCAAVAGILYTSICCSVYTLVAIAFVRWYVITKFIRGHRGLHTPKKIIVIAVIIWIFSVSAMVLPLVFGIGTLGYSEYYSICSLTDSNEDFYYVLFQGTLTATALLLTLLFYIRILIHVLLHNKLFRDKYSVDGDTGSTSTGASQSKTSTISAGSRPPMIKAINQKEIEITKNLFMVVCVFMLCFLATVVNFIIPGSSVLTLYSTMILLANSVVNPIIYGFKHPNFQEVFKKILCCQPVG